MPSFDHNEANRLTEAANAAQLKPTNEAPQRRAIRFQAGEPINRPSIRPFKHGQWQGFARPSLSLLPFSSSLSKLPECTVGNFMSRISKGCCRANRGRETRTNCILTHANCQCPHLPAFPPSPVRPRSAVPSKFIALQWPSERGTTVAYGPQLPLCTLPTDVECVGS